MALDPILNLVASWDGSAVDKKLRQLTSFKKLLTKPTEELVQDNLDDGEVSMPASTLLHLLFSRGPPELKLLNVGWSISRYSTWLDEHPNENDRLQFIQGALESYVASTRARNEKSYAFPYNIMLQVLQKAKSTA